jgi:hypothetical protein
MAKGIEDELRTQMIKNDELANMHVLTEKELAKVKRSAKGRINTDKEIIDSLKKERKKEITFRKKLEAEKEKNQLAKIDIEEERIHSQYIAQSKEEKSTRKVVESNMRYYQKIAESSKGQSMLLQSKLEI